VTKTVGAPAAEPIARTTARHWMVAAGAACLMLGGGFVVLSFSFLNPPMAKTLGVGLSEVMVYNSLMAIAGALSMILLSPVAMRRLGARRTLVAGSCWTAVGPVPEGRLNWQPLNVLRVPPAVNP